MTHYRMSDLDQVRAVTGTRRPKLMLQIFEALTDEFQTAEMIAKKSRSYCDQACKILSTLFRLDYVDRKQVKVRYSESRSQVYAYRKNGRNLVAEEYQEWKQEFDELNRKFNDIEVSQLRLNRGQHKWRNSDIR